MRYPERINKILPRVLKSLDIDERIKEIKILRHWPEIVGEKIASHARPINISEANLYVAVDNPLWQAELFLLKGRIIKKFNELGAKLKDIKFILKKEESI
ncbi:MAG: DUF721 domain-containing protein [candidate division WOR-3 bacterium]|nr:DUF721 domain-containing protein [candidate division WOR-3 bacterium]